MLGIAVRNSVAALVIVEGEKLVAVFRRKLIRGGMNRAEYLAKRIQELSRTYPIYGVVAEGQIATAASRLAGWRPIELNFDHAKRFFSARQITHRAFYSLLVARFPELREHVRIILERVADSATERYRTVVLHGAAIAFTYNLLGADG